MTSVVDIHKKGGKRPHFDVYIGRVVRFTEFTRSSKWANCYGSLKAYEKVFRRKIATNPKRYNIEELRGKRLGCWCITTDKTEPLVCHGQILMKMLFLESFKPNKLPKKQEWLGEIK